MDFKKKKKEVDRKLGTNTIGVPRQGNNWFLLSTFTSASIEKKKKILEEIN